MSETLGERVRREREDRRMFQRQLAAIAGVSAAYVSKIEHDKEVPNNRVLARMARALGVPFEELLLAARRVPADVLEILAEDPARGVQFLQQVRAGRRERRRP